MKLIVKQKGKRGIRLWFPNRLLFSKTALKIFRRSLADRLEKEEVLQDGQDTLEDSQEIMTPGLKWATDLKEHKKAMEGKDPEEIKELIRHEVKSMDRHSGFDFNSFMANLPDEKLNELKDLLCNMKKDHPGLPLVDVHAADGTRVLIQL